jgi:hypothetical protein
MRIVLCEAVVSLIGIFVRKATLACEIINWIWTKKEAKGK